MYITITPQQLDATYAQSVSDYVAYLEKENEDKEPELQETFYDQYHDHVSSKEVIHEIDANTDKLKKTEPKFYSLTINPSQRELSAIGNSPEKLREYTREVMKDYAAAFFRDKAVTVDQIKYYAKIEHERTYSGKDKEVRENRPIRARILQLENQIRKVERGELTGSIKKMQREIRRLEEKYPHTLQGRPIEEGMKKPGNQMHVHIIVSRKDVTNTYSLSPGSRYRESEATLNGQTVKRGFRRDEFFEKAEKTFDRMFEYNRNYVEEYNARKTLAKDPLLYFAKLAHLPTSERALAMTLLSKAGVKVPIPNIPKSNVEVALKTIRQFQKGLEISRRAGSIEI